MVETFDRFIGRHEFTLSNGQVITIRIKKALPNLQLDNNSGQCPLYVTFPGTNKKPKTGNISYPPTKEQLQSFMSEIQTILEREHTSPF